MWPCDAKGGFLPPPWGDSACLSETDESSIWQTWSEPTGWSQTQMRSAKLPSQPADACNRINAYSCMSLSFKWLIWHSFVTRWLIHWSRDYHSFPRDSKYHRNHLAVITLLTTTTIIIPLSSLLGKSNCCEHWSSFWVWFPVLLLNSSVILGKLLR